MAHRRKLSGEILITKKAINNDDLTKALEEQKKTGFRLGHSLIRLGVLKEKVLANALTEQNDLECHILKNAVISKEIKDKISYDFCIKNKCIPIGITDNEINMAMADPYDISLLDDIRFLTGLDVKPQFTTEYSIYQSIEKSYKGKSSHVPARIEKSDSHIINQVNDFIFSAIDQGASDIHLETYESKINLRFRVDGQLFNEKAPSQKDISSIISRIKIMSNLDIAEKRLPQDGRIIINDKGYDVDIRVSILPAINGENVVLRILDKKQGKFELNSLGLNEKNEDSIKKVLKKSHGLILITGPTGSGKTTTLYSMLNILNDPTRKILTIEDPVEYKIEDITQVEVNARINLTFASALRSFLRHDPDIIMVGEIRDKETAEIAIRAALTGHLVLSTIHTNDAPSAVARLLDMDVEPFLLTSTLEMIIGQRLVRTICKKCITKIKKKNKTVYIGKGCSECHKTGFKGRIGIFEVLSTSESIQDAVIERMSSGKIKDIARKDGFIDMSHDGMEKVKQGITTEDEILRVINESE